MAIRKIVTHGHPLLKKKCQTVTQVTPQIQTLIRDMFETMYAAPGIGLAANQIGVDLSIAVIDIQQSGRKQPMVLINPKIIETRGELFEEEGCLSIPSLGAKIKRFAYTKVAALNELGLPTIVVGEGLLSRALQHETDHLNGKFYIDHLPMLEKVKMQNSIRKMKSSGQWD